MALHFTPSPLQRTHTSTSNIYERESVPSLAYSDASYDDYNSLNSSSIMPSETEDINDVIDEALVKMARIVDHLRDRNQNEAANHVSREMTTTFRYLYETVATYSMEDCIMKAASPERFSLVGSTDVVAPPPTGPKTNTWAAIAATAPAAGNQLIKYRPSDALKQNVMEQEVVQQEQNTQDQRVVWIRPWRGGRSLSAVTDSMDQLGAIYSMAYAREEESVCIIFQHASCAIQFQQDHADFVSRNGTSKFGPGVTVTPGNPFPMNDDLRRMDSPINERRRLTFARQQLFHEVTEQKFRADLAEIVGAANIELVWLFNTGNATVVFSAVPLARLARNHFRQVAKHPKSPYEGLIVTFSHDPCERAVRLVTQIPEFPPNDYRNRVPGYTPSERSTTSRRLSNLSSSSANHRRIGGIRKPYIDADGWHTVGKKR